jgi:glutamate-1-semialdehyde 2,1-aminomutase
MSSRYQKSVELFNRAESVIPLGTQTFSKSKTQYPVGAAPLYIDKVDGAHVWDVDGNQYIDFVNGLAAITLGYNDADVNAAVAAQLQKSTIASLPVALEIDLAEKIKEMVPCADMVRFGKNGSDVTSAAVRLARAYTGRDHIACGGYHGWQDWFIGSTSMNLGVPEATQALTHKFTFNDLASLEKVFVDFPDQVAAVILEPISTQEPEPGYLEAVKALTHQHGAVLIFDEVVTGFRCHTGGAQALYNVTPDLTALGKGMANGFPVSAVVGSEKIMKLAEKIFFSFTFGSEALSIAASLATLNKLQSEPVIEHLCKLGTYLKSGVDQLIQKHGLSEMLAISGNPAWSFLAFKDTQNYKGWELKALFQEKTLEQGILTLGGHNMTYAHTQQHVDTLLSVYDEVFPLLKRVDAEKSLQAHLICEPNEPLFKVR